LSVQVDDMTKALAAAGMAATSSSNTLEAQTRRAEAVAAKLELLVASLHDLPGGNAPPAPPQRAEPETESAAAAPRPRPRVVRSRLGSDDLEAAE
jgi:hypothetical protein